MTDKKKALVPMITGISTLLILVIGATYAYFATGLSDRYGTSAISANTENVEGGLGIALVSGNNFNFALTASDMKDVGQDITYYATETGKSTTETDQIIGTAQLTGAGIYKCSYTLSLDDNTNSMYDAFQTMASKSEGQIVLTIGDKVLDFNTEGLFPQTITGKLAGITASNPRYIKAQLKLVNKTGVNQNALAGTTLDISIDVEEFNCEEVNLPVSSDNLSTELVGGLYRYQGTKDEVDDNYICFGTTDLSECTTNMDEHMYRIIGVTEEGQLKLIKKTDLAAMKWAENASADVPWTSSIVYTGINGDSYLNNDTYVPEGWEEKIADTNWKYGTMTLEDLGIAKTSDIAIDDMSSLTGDDYYNIEGNFETTVPAKIGLMYVHDFYYQNGSGTCVIDDTENLASSECINGWLNMLNNDSTPTDSSGMEWMMTYYGYDSVDSYYLAWYEISNISFTYPGTLVSDIGVRPVFFLKSGLTITGEGTIDSPYLIN